MNSFYLPIKPFILYQCCSHDRVYTRENKTSSGDLPVERIKVISKSPHYDLNQTIVGKSKVRMDSH